MSGRDRAGWVLFLVSAGLFAVAGLRAGDALTVGASVVFGLGCVLFLLTRR